MPESPARSRYDHRFSNGHSRYRHEHLGLAELAPGQPARQRSEVCALRSFGRHTSESRLSPVGIRPGLLVMLPEAIP